jgi:hypothetical protein
MNKNSSCRAIDSSLGSLRVRFHLFELVLVCFFILLSTVSAHAVEGINLDPSPVWFTGDIRGSTISVAWGDVDGDGDLDLVTSGQKKLWSPAELGGSITLYINTQGVLQPAPTLISEDTYPIYSVAWGDVDGDGDLDLAAGGYGGATKVYVNESGNLSDTYKWSDDTNCAGAQETICEHYPTRAVAWGDMNGDGALDLIVGNEGAPNQIYFNKQGVLQKTKVWTDMLPDRTTSIALGDVDRDGDLDLVVGNGPAVRVFNTTCTPQQNRFYENLLADNNTFELVRQDIGSPGCTYTVALGDVNSVDDKSHLELAVGFLNGPSKVYSFVRDGEHRLQTQELWHEPIHRNFARSLAWGDANSDGDLDLAIAVDGYIKIYSNQGGALEATIPSFESNSVPNLQAIAWGDVDQDGDLDLAAGQSDHSHTSLFQNKGGQLWVHEPWSADDHGTALSIAWGDLDNDADLDLVAGMAGQSKVYWNVNGKLDKKGSTFSPDIFDTHGIALGDVDGDDFLDLVTGNGSRPCTFATHRQPDKVYLNDKHGNLSSQDMIIGDPNDPDCTKSVALGDVDGDGDLDLAVGNGDNEAPERNRLYLNDGHGIFTRDPHWNPKADKTFYVAWGDMDRDGDLDLAVANENEPNYIYRNDAGMLTNMPVWQSLDAAPSGATAWGDVDGDGYLDLAVRSWSNPKKLYANERGTLKEAPVWYSNDNDNTLNIAWGDVDGDGDLDLAASNKGNSKLYINEEGVLQPNGLINHPTTDPDQTYYSLAWGDVDQDGDLDLALGLENSPSTIKVYTNGQNNGHREPFNLFPTVSIRHPITTGAAGFYSSQTILTATVIPIRYTLNDKDGDNIGHIAAYFSTNGGDNWKPAVAANPNDTVNVSPGEHLFLWDTFHSKFFGQSDNVVFRLEAFPGPLSNEIGAGYRYTNTTPGPFQFASASAVTFPFRIRGSQVQVIDDLGKAVEGAVVYRIPDGTATGGFPLGINGVPFHTDAQGYLQGYEEIGPGDRLLALAPQSLPMTTTMTWTVGLTDTVHLYFTNAKPISTGIEALISNTQSTTVTQPGVQVLQVSSKYPLILFDLRMALEWDASTDPNQIYLSQLRSDLHKTAEFLYDFTNGQATLGVITITQAAEDWMFADIFVEATNRLRPLAVQGGVVITATPDIDPSLGITYTPGQVRMGSTWNRYGAAGQNLGYDWPLALAHELSHYLFFLNDTYIGLNERGLLIAVDQCQNSVMGDMYNSNGKNTEFIADKGLWEANCQETLANRTLQRTEWETIQQRYPALLTDSPNITNPGPSLMPFELISVTVLSPLTPTNTLPDPIIFLDYQNEADNIVSSPGTRAFLIRDEQYLFDLGTAVGGQNRLLARGATPGDTLCVFDPTAKYSGCDTVSSSAERLQLQPESNWTPRIEIHPVTTTTLNIQVSAISITAPMSLHARIFPEMGVVTRTTILTQENNNTYSATISSTYPIASGHLELWLNDGANNELAPTPTTRRTIVAFTVGGNFGDDPALWAVGPHIRAGGPHIRAGGPHIRAGGPFYRGGNAPVASSDGQLIFFTADPNAFNKGDLYTIQSVAAYPDPPSNTAPVGLVYSLIASTGAQMITGSVSFQYLGIDALSLGITEADEQGLMVYHCCDTEGKWIQLSTVINIGYNLASAPSRGQGLYAMLAKVMPPYLESAEAALAGGSATSFLIKGRNLDATIELLLRDCTGVSHIVPVQSISDTQISVVLPLEPGKYTVKVLKDNRASAESIELTIPGDSSICD